jgi:hypothetical protein
LLLAGSDTTHASELGTKPRDYRLVSETAQGLLVEHNLDRTKAVGNVSFEIDAHALLLLCALDLFHDSIVTPLLESGDCQSLSLLRHVFDALPAYWRKRHDGARAQLAAARPSCKVDFLTRVAAGRKQQHTSDN